MDILIVELGNNGLFSKFAFILKFVISFLRLKPDFVFCSHINFSPIGLFFKKFFGRDYIIFTHGIEVWKIGSALKRKSLARAKIVVTVSEFTKRKLLEEIPAINGKIFLLPNFVDGDKFFIKKKIKPNSSKNTACPEIAE